MNNKAKAMMKEPEALIWPQNLSWAGQQDCQGRTACMSVGTMRKAGVRVDTAWCKSRLAGACLSEKKPARSVRADMPLTRNCLAPGMEAIIGFSRVPDRRLQRQDEPATPPRH
jgi:hypothetical protein